MSLFQYRQDVDYPKQQAAFKEFLTEFKTFESTSEGAAAEAIEDLSLGDDDEYDMMDDGPDGAGGQQRRRRDPKVKYKQILQDIADRNRSDILIELDDLVKVRFGSPGLIALS